VLFCLFPPVHTPYVQFLCSSCRTWKLVRHKHGSKCSDCQNRQHRHLSSPAATALSSSAASPPPPLFDRPQGCLDQLTEIQRGSIVTLHKIGWLHKDIAPKIPCSEKTVSLWVQRWQEEHSVADNERGGRPRCTDEEADVAMEEFADEKKFVTPRDIRRELQLHCSVRTVRRRLDEVNLFGRVAREADSYDERTLTLRLSFARGFQHFTDADWDTVIFSDEVHFCLGYHGQVWVQRPPGRAYDPQYCHPPDEPAYTVTLWGCFCSQGMGAGRIFLGELNSQLYRDILEHNLKPSYQRFFPRGLWRFQQDNASPHYTAEVNTWMHNHGVHVLEFPPRSPDFNPIENIWHVLKHRVEHRNPRTGEELERILGEEYEAFSAEECATLAHSMHNRLLQCIQYQGHKTKY
jgi:transposase